jgi:hypothetical protein
MARARTKPKLESEGVERRLFEFSLGPLRLLDTVLDKAGQGKRGGLLRDLLIDWRAYPSRTVHSHKDLLRFAAAVGSIEGGTAQGPTDRRGKPRGQDQGGDRGVDATAKSGEYEIRIVRQHRSHPLSGTDESLISTG